MTTMQRLIAFKIHKIIDQDSDANYDELVEELPQWQEELERLQKLRPVVSNHNSLKVKEIPALQEQIKEQESDHPDISSGVEQVGPRS
jgi:DNA repair protein RAD50